MCLMEVHTLAAQGDALDKVWLKSYPAGVPAEIDPSEYTSILDVFDASCRRFADLAAFESMGTELSYRELDRHSRSLAAFLQSDLGLRQGERLAIMLPNLLQYPVTLFAALRAGLTVVNCNPLYTPRELEHQLRDSGATAIVALENFAHTLEQVVDKTQIRAVVMTRSATCCRDRARCS